MYEYQLEMVQTNNVIFYIYYGVEAYIKRNVEALNPELKQTLQILNSVTEHANRT
jgi:hypothetical protein